MSGERFFLQRKNEPLELTQFRSVRSCVQESANVSSMSLCLENVNHETYLSRHSNIHFFFSNNCTHPTEETTKKRATRKGQI